MRVKVQFWYSVVLFNYNAVSIFYRDAVWFCHLVIAIAIFKIAIFQGQNLGRHEALVTPHMIGWENNRTNNTTTDPKPENNRTNNTTVNAIPKTKELRGNLVQ